MGSSVAEERMHAFKEGKGGAIRQNRKKAHGKRSEETGVERAKYSVGTSFGARLYDILKARLRRFCL